MAASDQTYRSQKALHLTFAVASVAMLATTVWMFWDDYNRPYKKEQRVFREVEEELAKRALLAEAPPEQDRAKVMLAEQDVARTRAVLRAVRAEADKETSRLGADQVKDDRSRADVKATADSLASFYNIEVEQHGPDTAAAKQFLADVQRYREQVEKYTRDLEQRQAQIDETNHKKYKVKVGDKEEENSPDDAATELARAEDAHKKVTESFDRFVKLANQKQWGLGYELRQMPVLDAFASPVKIQQYTLDELPIDYSFKFVTRYDRCTTCHLSMEKPTYDKETLAELADDPNGPHKKAAADAITGAIVNDTNAQRSKESKEPLSADEVKQIKERVAKGDYDKAKYGGLATPRYRQMLTNAIVALTDRQRITDGKPALTDEEVKALKERVAQGNFGDYKQYVPERVDLSDARITQFAAHPRLDLFVDANSPHPAEKFGCSACHGGQGSATDFVNAVHTPNDPLQRERWEKDNGWEHIHFWDYPMNPQRFGESACLKCHHQVTDLIRDGNHVEAPKLVQGYNLVRELGCFGCHEIAGINKNRWVGPDLRLEPDPPIESLSPEERAKRLSDPMNPPGSMRKVGPNLARLAEKTYEEWARQWIKSPRSFRPDTKMPHYYGQPNNVPDALPPEQKGFPDAEVAAITHYLFATSKDMLKQVKEHGKDDDAARKADEEQAKKLTDQLAGSGLSDRQKHDFGVQLADVQARIAARRMAPLAADDVKLPPAPVDEKARGEQLERGRHLFSTRGCLACHQHAATTKEGGQFDGKPVPAIDSDHTFGPELSRLAAKLGTKAGDPQSARAWLVRWILNPSAHNPRTYMPAPFHADDPHVAEQEADDIAAWLLAQPVTPDDRNFAPVAQVDEATLKKLARVWLDKVATRRDVETVLDKGQGFTKAQIENKPADADERFLEGEITPDKLMMYVGKKAINNYGCYGCHSIPGFESAKPIGTGLNDWGKKDPERIAFEDSEHYVHDHFNIVDVRRDLTPREMEENERLPEDKRAKTWAGPKSYEKFYAEQIDHGHQTRVGFLHLKLQQPRSYDYNRVRGWDERLRMPQFKFARSKRLANESDGDYEKRLSKEEDEAREAVMTFVLGLVAEPVPANYVNAPAGDKAALVKGRQVLDKFNCAGCHLVQPGNYDFKLTRDKFGEKDVEKDGKTVKETVTLRDAVLGRLDEKYGANVELDADKYGFPEHNCWAGTTPKDPNRFRAYGITRPEGAFTNEDNDKYGSDEQFLLMRLTRAMRYVNAAGEPRDIPGGTDVMIPRQAIAGHFDHLGGDFMNGLAKYLQVRDPQTYGQQNDNKSFAAGPPTLTHEGEKVQPVWLFQFLKNPVPIRPMAVLRMPRFNISTDDAQALVNYFAASNRMTNPGIGLTYPYLAVPERDESYIAQKSAEYDARLQKIGTVDARAKEMQPVWARMTRDRIADAEARLKTAKAQVDEAKKNNQDAGPAQKVVDSAEGDLRKLKANLDTNDFKDLRRDWEQREAYVTDAFKLVANDQLCLQCHQIGSIPSKENQGPQLSLAADRLRPDWVERWLANPQRFLTYKTIMPVNFKKGAKENEDKFIGGADQAFSLDQITAVRDFLMIFPQVADWPVLKNRPATGTAGGK